MPCFLLPIKVSSVYLDICHALLYILQLLHSIVYIYPSSLLCLSIELERIRLQTSIFGAVHVLCWLICSLRPQQNVGRDILPGLRVSYDDWCPLNLFTVVSTSVLSRSGEVLSHRVLLPVVFDTRRLYHAIVGDTTWHRDVTRFSILKSVVIDLLTVSVTFCLKDGGRYVIEKTSVVIIVNLTRTNCVALLKLETENCVSMCSVWITTQFAVKKISLCITAAV